MQFVLDTSAVGTFCEHDSHPTYRRKRADYALYYQIEGDDGEVLTRAACAAHLTKTIDAIASARIESAIAANKAARASASPSSETLP